MGLSVVEWGVVGWGLGLSDGWGVVGLGVVWWSGVEWGWV